MDSVENTFISSTFWSERAGYTVGLKTIELMKKKKKHGKKFQKLGVKFKKDGRFI